MVFEPQQRALQGWRMTASINGIGAALHGQAAVDDHGSYGIAERIRVRVIDSIGVTSCVAD